MLLSREKEVELIKNGLQTQLQTMHQDKNRLESQVRQLKNRYGGLKVQLSLSLSFFLSISLSVCACVSIYTFQTKPNETKYIYTDQLGPE